MSTPDLLLLDTHIWIWLMIEHPKLGSSKVLPRIIKASKAETLRVAAISVWEVAMLESKGRITFPLSCQDWINQALGAPGIGLVPLSPEIAVESSRLPGNFHGDPADRILVATARKLGATLISDDAKIKRYAEEGHVNALALR